MARVQRDPSLRILDVSLSIDDEASKWYADVLTGEAVAHMVHYGESSFATVFTDVQPAPEKISVRGIAGILFRRHNANGGPTLPEEDRALVVFAARQACEARQIDTSGEMFYLHPLSEDSVRAFIDPKN